MKAGCFSLQLRSTAKIELKIEEMEKWKNYKEPDIDGVLEVLHVSLLGTKDLAHNILALFVELLARHGLHLGRQLARFLKKPQYSIIQTLSEQFRTSLFSYLRRTFGSSPSFFRRSKRTASTCLRTPAGPSAKSEYDQV